MGEYMDAYEKDLSRLLKELKAARATLKSKPGDKAAQKKVDEIAPHLTEKALDARRDRAALMDKKDLGKTVKTLGLPGW